MAKQAKTAEELEAMIMESVGRLTECSDLTGVKILPLGRDPNWTANGTYGSTPMCDQAIYRAMARLQEQYSLKT